MKQIPNIFTLLNLICGCLAIRSVLQNGIAITGNADGATWIDIPEELWMASLYIAVGALIDFLDGFLARALHAGSAMGKQLDSLADVVTFGVAPGMILYQFLRLSLARENQSLDAPEILLYPAFLLPAAAAWRLARYNITVEQPDYFRGLPVPATGIFFASFPLIYWNVQTVWVQQLLMNKWFLYAVAIGFAGLMISRWPLLALKFRDLSLSNNRAQYLLLLTSIIALVLLKWLALPLVIVIYILLSLLFPPDRMGTART